MDIDAEVSTIDSFSDIMFDNAKIAVFHVKIRRFSFYFGLVGIAETRNPFYQSVPQSGSPVSVPKPYCATHNNSDHGYMTSYTNPNGRKVPRRFRLANNIAPGNSAQSITSRDSRCDGGTFPLSNNVVGLISV